VTAGRPRRGLAARLFAAQLLVIVAGSLTLAVVALAVAPGLFRTHVRRALGDVAPEVAGHLDEAFGGAMLTALAIAVTVALLTALAVSSVLALQIVRPIRALAMAAEKVARGRYEARVPTTGPGELAALGGAFNAMAVALDSSERRRRALLADLAHELRTPLATIEGYVEGIADGVIEADADAVQVLQGEASRLRRLVEDLATVSRAEEGQLGLRLERWDPGRLVAAAVQAAGPRYAAKGVALEARVGRRLPKVAADPDRIGEVLANLLDNALRHTPPRGRVEVVATAAGGEVRLSVADTGEGIPAELLGRVFERFYRVDRARTRADGGSGIGLTIARAIVQAHGGRIRAESDGPGRGSLFMISIPAMTGQRGQSRRREPVLRPPGRQDP